MVCNAATGLVSACLGIQLEDAHEVLLAPALAALNRAKPFCAHFPGSGASPAPLAAAAEQVRVQKVRGWSELQAVLLAGGATTGLTWEAVSGLIVLYNEPYSHKTDVTALWNAVAAAGCTHVVVAAAQAGEEMGRGKLKVAAAGEVRSVLGGTCGEETLVSHGVHWYCREGRDQTKCFGFAPNADIAPSTGWFADKIHKDDPLRLSWRVDGTCGGYRAGDVCDLDNSNDWRKLMWGFSL